MRLTEHTIVACTIALLLATAPLAFAAEQPGQITPENKYTQTVDDNTVSISFVVNTSGKQRLAESKVNLTQVPNELELISNRTQSVEQLASNERAVVTYEVRIPSGTPTGNYTLHAELMQQKRVLDSANYTIWVHYGSQQSNPDGTSDEAQESTESESSGGAVAIMAERDCGWTCIDDNARSWLADFRADWKDNLLPDWSFEDLVPDWDFNILS